MTAALSAAQRLRKEYAILRQGGVLGPSQRLFALERLARASLREDGDGQLLAFTIANVIADLARRQDGDAVTYSLGSALFEAIDQPLTAAIDGLCGLPGSGAPEQLAAALVQAYCAGAGD